MKREKTNLPTGNLMNAEAVSAAKDMIDVPVTTGGITLKRPTARCANMVQTHCWTTLPIYQRTPMENNDKNSKRSARRSRRFSPIRSRKRKCRRARVSDSLTGNRVKSIHDADSFIHQEFWHGSLDPHHPRRCHRRLCWFGFRALLPRIAE